MQFVWILPNVILNQLDSKTDEEDLPNTVLPTEISGLIMKICTLMGINLYH